MWVSRKFIFFIKRGRYNIHEHFRKPISWRSYYTIPFLDLYQKTTGQTPSDYFLEKLKKKHPGIDTLSRDQIQCTLDILKKFEITPEDACYDPHVFTMIPISMDNYGEILKECGFVKIMPKHIIRYHTLVRSRTIAWLKKESLLRADLNLEEELQECFQEWPSNNNNTLENFSESETNILTIRMSVLQKYLNWRLGVTPDEFSRYCRNYLPIKHRPMCDIQETLDIAECDINFDTASIRRNGFIIHTDPMNTKFILKNVDSLAYMDIREAIRIEPAILKNNYNALLQIRSLLQEYEISKEAQKRCLKIYCMHPASVQERLEDLRNLKEYQVLKTNPRVLSLVVHKRKMMNRLEKIQAAKKQCFSLNHLVSSSKVFNTYISNFGNKVCGRDLAILISSSLSISNPDDQRQTCPETKLILKKLKRHKFWLHAALKVIDENIQFLKKNVNDKVIFNNCQLLLYPSAEIEHYITFLQKMRNEASRNYTQDIQLDASYNNLNYAALNDDQILSLVLYEIEKKYHFSGDGIWGKQDGVKAEANAS